MRKFLVLAVVAFILSGCAIPLPLQIASWAVDGISMLATHKSVADHGISLLAQKDCAVWRGVTAGELCRNAISSDTMVADDAVKSPTKSGLTRTVSFDPSLASSLASFSNDMNDSVQLSIMPHIHVSSLSTSPEKLLTEVSIATSKLKSIQVVENVAPIIEFSNAEFSIIEQTTSGIEPAKGVYFVVGSFHNISNAKRLLDSITKFSPSVLSAKLDGSLVYRVVVGPVKSGLEKNLHRILARNGLHDTWAIRVDPSEWRFASFPKTLSLASLRLATLQN